MHTTRRTLGVLRTAGPGVLAACLVLALVISGGGAWAVGKIGAKDIKRDAVRSKQIKNGAVKTRDLAAGAVTAGKVRANSLTGNEIDESTLSQVPDAGKLAGRLPATFLNSAVYKAESAVTAGIALGDGTFTIEQACNAGDVLLSGGPANVNATSVMVESFPAPGSTNAWKARIKPAGADNFSVVVLCIDQ